jgi:hypothetical protein
MGKMRRVVDEVGRRWSLKVHAKGDAANHAG